jgi:hypothetical protein
MDPELGLVADGAADFVRDPRQTGVIRSAGH